MRVALNGWDGKSPKHPNNFKQKQKQLNQNEHFSVLLLLGRISCARDGIHLVSPFRTFSYPNKSEGSTVATDTDGGVSTTTPDADGDASYSDPLEAIVVSVAALPFGQIAILISLLYAAAALAASAVSVCHSLRW
jgi:hypothetical protein